jgi:hypothetical protein
MPLKHYHSVVSSILLKVTIAVVLLTGCASVKIGEYQHSKKNRNYSKTKDNLSVSINPITDSAESKKYFGRDILSSGVLAVHILIENQSLSDNYIFEKDKIAFGERDVLVSKTNCSADEKIQENEQVATSKQVIGISVSALVTPLALPLYFSGLSDMRNINAVKHNMITKELRTKIVHPGESIQGFVYFRIKTDALKKANNNRLDVPYMHMGKSKPCIFQFTL